MYFCLPRACARSIYTNILPDLSLPHNYVTKSRGQRSTVQKNTQKRIMPFDSLLVRFDAPAMVFEFNANRSRFLFTGGICVFRYFFTMAFAPPFLRPSVQPNGCFRLSTTAATQAIWHVFFEQRPIGINEPCARSDFEASTRRAPHAEDALGTATRRSKAFCTH